eukprot:jgi/Botrbrau1/2497/Bobra.0226s0053.1
MGFHSRCEMRKTRSCTHAEPSKGPKRLKTLKAPDPGGTTLGQDQRIPPSAYPSYTLMKLKRGVLIKRYKRFLADVLLDGESEPTVVHCPNTGPMTGLLDRPMAPVLVSTSSNAKRKYRHTLELIQPEESGAYVGVHSAMANAVVAAFLSSGIFSAELPHVSVRREVADPQVRGTRIDFVLEGPGGKLVYVEVKSVTLAEALPGQAKKIALFPDTVSQRALRHTQHLTQVVRDGHGAVLLFVIQRGDCEMFAPCHVKDPAYGKAVLEAVQAGVQVLALRCSWHLSACHTSATLVYDGQAEVDLVHSLSS